MAENLVKPSFISSSRTDQLPRAHPLRHRRRVSVFPPLTCTVKSGVSSSSSSSRCLMLNTQTLKSGDFYGRRIALIEGKTSPIRQIYGSRASMTSQIGFRIGKAQKWWEKELQPNMKEVTSAQDLVNSLSNAGDTLVVVDFFSPGCGGCKALHPKICQMAQMNPDVLFLQINYEEHKSMCYSLNVHVLPFFRFYRGAHGRLCSFSCTNATIKKFKDAISKHKTERCSLGPTKGLEEKELMALAANKDLSFNYSPPERAVEEAEEGILSEEGAAFPLPNLTSSNSTQDSNKACVHAWR